MTEDLERMLRLLLANQVDIMNALSELLSDDPNYEDADQYEDQREDLRLNLDTGAGITEQFLKDAKKEAQIRQSEGQTKN